MQPSLTTSRLPSGSAAAHDPDSEPGTSSHGRSHASAGWFATSATRPAPQMEEKAVPLINVKVIEGVFSEDQKADMVKSLTEAMVVIEGENMRPVTWVIVEDVKSGAWGIGGNPLTTADVQALAAGAPAG